MKYNAINKRNGKEFIVEHKVNGEIIATEVESGKEKQITESTIKRWYELGEKITEESEIESKILDEELNKMIEFIMMPEKIKKAKKAKKIENVQKVERTDKFKPKLSPEQVIEIRGKFKAGMRKSHLAKEYNVSFRTITCIVEYLMWKKVG